MEAKKKEHLKLEKQSGLYFAIGMTLILGLVYAALEWKTFDPIINGTFGQLEIPDSLEEEIPPLVQLLPPPPPKIQVPEVIEIVPDDPTIIETIITAVEPDYTTEVPTVDQIAFEEVETIPEVTWVTKVFSGAHGVPYQEWEIRHILALSLVRW